MDGQEEKRWSKEGEKKKRKACGTDEDNDYEIAPQQSSQGAL